ncbi:AAA family ATPase [Marinomonas sp. C2222]|uniref:AAA family ATPase n=1 Tax=Marinomonas sargassi TaxID=2984494 RepID=A0ABT2YRG2_9GAMM|nr:AAA family ATPase [Marinomonas sargassi]MCV2402239.1 AAA family ATPase [Marinomonas sargassi]
MAILYIFSGLPASGKSTLAKLLASKTSSMYVRVDTIEQALKDLCGLQVEAEGYQLSYRLIEENLALGISCIADSCNTIALSRHEWQSVADNLGVKFVNIEVCCSDKKEHEDRVSSRKSDINNLTLPNWQQVQNRHYEPWQTDIITIDTAGQTIQASFAELLEKLAR